MRAQFTRCLGCRFSPRELRPTNPVPIVMVGARLVHSPELPVLLPTFTATRSTGTSAAYCITVSELVEWMAALCPAPAMRTKARAVAMPEATLGKLKIGRAAGRDIVCQHV